MDKFNKRKFDGVREQGSHRGHWDRVRHDGHRNSETQNGAIFGGGRGGGRDGNNDVGCGAQGGNGSKNNPPHQDGQKTLGGGQNGHEGGRSA